MQSIASVAKTQWFQHDSNELRSNSDLLHHRTYSHPSRRPDLHRNHRALVLERMERWKAIHFQRATTRLLYSKQPLRQSGNEDCPMVTSSETSETFETYSTRYLHTPTLTLLLTWRYSTSVRNCPGGRCHRITTTTLSIYLLTSP